MSIRRTGFFLVVLVLMGCGGSYSTSQLHRTVKPHPNREGVYLAYYEWNDMINKYGPGLAKVRIAVKQAFDSKDKLVIWNQVMAAAVSKYLEENRLVPTDCIHGVTVISSNKDEAGGGTTAFRCRK